MRRTPSHNRTARQTVMQRHFALKANQSMFVVHLEMFGQYEMKRLEMQLLGHGILIVWCDCVFKNHLQFNCISINAASPSRAPKNQTFIEFSAK